MVDLFEHALITIIAADMTVEDCATIEGNASNNWDITNIAALFSVLISDMRYVHEDEDIYVELYFKDGSGNWNTEPTYHLKCQAGECFDLQRFHPLWCLENSLRVKLLGTRTATGGDYQDLTEDENVHITLSYNKVATS